MMLRTKRLIKELVLELTDARTQAWFAMESEKRVRLELTVMEAVCLEQEIELAHLKQRLGES